MTFEEDLKTVQENYASNPNHGTLFKSKHIKFDSYDEAMEFKDGWLLADDRYYYKAFGDIIARIDMDDCRRYDVEKRKVVPNSKEASVQYWIEPRDILSDRGWLPEGI